MAFEYGNIYSNLFGKKDKVRHYPPNKIIAIPTFEVLYDENNEPKVVGSVKEIFGKIYVYNNLHCYTKIEFISRNGDG
jgi:hypothetical protein